MILRPPRPTLFPTRRSSDLERGVPGERGPGDLCAGNRPREDAKGGNRRRGGREQGPDRRDHDRSGDARGGKRPGARDRKSTRLNSSHLGISYAVFCLKKKKK